MWQRNQTSNRNFKKRFSQHGESTDITINKYVHENTIAEVLGLRVVHFIVWMWKFDYQ